MLCRFVSEPNGELSAGRLDVIGSDELSSVRHSIRQSRRRGDAAFGLLLGPLQIEAQKERQGIFLLAHAVDSADGGVERGMGFVEPVDARGFEGG